MKRTPINKNNLIEKIQEYSVKRWFKKMGFKWDELTQDMKEVEAEPYIKDTLDYLEERHYLLFEKK